MNNTKKPKIVVNESPHPARSYSLAPRMVKEHDCPICREYMTRYPAKIRCNFCGHTIQLDYEP